MDALSALNKTATDLLFCFTKQKLVSERAEVY